MIRQVIIYGAQLIASELYRYLRRHHSWIEIVCFAVTNRRNQSVVLEKISVINIDEAVCKYPMAAIYIAAQEKHHIAMETQLAKLGKVAIESIGLRRMTAWLKQDGIKQIHRCCNKIKVIEDAYDYTMLSIQVETLSEECFKFYPMGQLPLKASEVEYLRNFADGGSFKTFFGNYRSLNNFRTEKFSIGDNCNSLFVAMASSAGDVDLSRIETTNDWTKRVYAGAALQNIDIFKSNEVQYIRDDAGENISLENRDYAELSVTYWLWKNFVQADYLGLCHYRRHFILEECALELIKRGKIDVILTKPRITFPTVKDFFIDSSLTTLIPKDYELMMEAIRCRDEACFQYAEGLFEDHIQCPNNMVIAKQEIFSVYCSWMFAVLNDIKNYYQQKGIERNDRYLAYAGEMLTTLFFAYHHERYRIMYVDYKLLD